MKNGRQFIKDLLGIYLLSVLVGAIPVGVAFGLIGWVVQTGSLELLYCLVRGCVIGCGLGMIVGIPFAIGFAVDDA